MYIYIYTSHLFLCSFLKTLSIKQQSHYSYCLLTGVFRSSVSALLWILPAHCTSTQPTPTNSAHIRSNRFKPDRTRAELETLFALTSVWLVCTIKHRFKSLRYWMFGCVGSYLVFLWLLEVWRCLAGGKMASCRHDASFSMFWLSSFTSLNSFIVPATFY